MQTLSYDTKVIRCVECAWGPKIENNLVWCKLFDAWKELEGFCDEAQQAEEAKEW